MTFPDARVDALDRLIMHDASAHVAQPGSGDGDILVLDDRSGALTQWALAHVGPHSRVFVRTVSRAHALTVQAAVHGAAAKPGEAGRNRVLIAGLDGSELDLESFLAAHGFSGRLALGRLPKPLAALEENARMLARHARRSGTEMIVVLGGATKHMTRSMNDALATGFTEVRGLLGKGKFRCLEASTPRESVTVMPPRTTRWGGGTLTAFGGVFSGAKPDRGGEALADAAASWLAARPQHAAPTARVLDLGCGNGMLSLAVCEAAGRTGCALTLAATDIDLDAIRSTRATLEPYRAQPGVTPTLTWDSAAAQHPDSSVDLVLLNPPFHDGTRIDATLVEPLIEAAYRILEPGGELLLVHNSHLRYRPLLKRRFAATREVSRGRTFTVLSAKK